MGLVKLVYVVTFHISIFIVTTWPISTKQLAQIILINFVQIKVIFNIQEEITKREWKICILKNAIFDPRNGGH